MYYRDTKSGNNESFPDFVQKERKLNTEVMFSSATDSWSTPQEFFDSVAKEFPFSLDVCASPENAKCTEYYTKEDDGLKQNWKGICWMNPPYGDPEFPCKKNCKKKSVLNEVFIMTDMYPE